MTRPHIADLGVNSDLPATPSLGAVHLTVADLGRAVAWYERSLGLHVASSGADRAELADGRETVLVLREDPAARPPARSAGL